MGEGIKYHSDVCERCNVRREVRVWRRDGAYSATMPGKCPHKEACAAKLVADAGFELIPEIEQAS